LSTDTADCSGKSGGGIEAIDVAADELEDEVTALSLSLELGGGGGAALVDEVEELYTAAAVCASGIGAVPNTGITPVPKAVVELLGALLEGLPEELLGTEIVAKIGPLTILPVGNNGARIPRVGEDPEEDEEGTPFRAENIPALPVVEEAEDPFAMPLPEAAETEDSTVDAEPRTELEPKGEYEEYPPLIVKFAHVTIVLLA
jgi:hypothetical protein